MFVQRNNQKVKQMSSIEFDQRVTGIRTNLFYFALRLTKNNDDAHDLVQEALLKALTYKDKFNEGTNFKAWVHTILKNLFINDHRRSVRGRTVMDNLENEKSQWFDRTSPNSPLSAITLKNIHAEVNALEDDYKVPFELHYEGFKYHEIAEELNIPIGTVKTRIFVARKKLRTILSEYQDSFGFKSKA